MDIQKIQFTAESQLPWTKNKVRRERIQASWEEQCGAFILSTIETARRDGEMELQHTVTE